MSLMSFMRKVIFKIISKREKFNNCSLTGFGSYTHCLKEAVAVLRNKRPGDAQVIVTLSLYGTNTLSGSSLMTLNPSFLSSDNVTQRASGKQEKKFYVC